MPGPLANLASDTECSALSNVNRNQHARIGFVLLSRNPRAEDNENDRRDDENFDHDCLPGWLAT